jgi:type I restriction enzyme S subunit
MNKMERTVELGKLITPAKPVRCGSGSYPVLSMTMHSGLVFQDEKFKKVIASKDTSDYKVVYRNQLVISFPIDEGVLAAQRITDAGIVSPAYGIWDIDQTQVLPEFLECALRCDRAIQYYKAKLRGSTARRRSLPTPTLLAFQVPLPGIEEQQDILDKVHRARAIKEKRENQIKKLDDLIKARFVEMFVGKNFPLVSVDDLSFGKGEYGAQSASVDYDASRPRYVRITDINDDGTLNDDFVSSSNVGDDKQYKLSYGDFLFARMGATVGKTYAFKEGNQIYAGYLIRYKLNLDKVMPEYLYAYTRLEEYWNWVKLNQSGAAQPGINAKKYGSLHIPVPPMSLQKEFQTFVGRVDKSKLLKNNYRKDNNIKTIIQ